MASTRTTTWSNPLELAQRARRLYRLNLLRSLIDGGGGVPIGEALGLARIRANW